MLLIPTQLKEKLPAGFSYPVGAEAISAALRDVPFFDELELWFSWKDQFWASEYQEKLESRGPIAVIDARHNLSWTIRVNSVPRTHASVARELIQEQALPSLVKALVASSEAASGFRWTAIFDLATSTLSSNAAPVLSDRRSRGRFRAPVRARTR